MAESELAKQEKQEVWKRIEKTVGFTMRQVAPRRKDWRESPSGELSVFVTFSKDSQLFYDVQCGDLQQWLGYKRAFVVFVMGTCEEALIIPAQCMKELVKDLTPKGREEYKLHIIRTGTGYKFREVPGHNLKPFLNNYGLLRNYYSTTVNFCVTTTRPQ
ncbi:hypothetical protein FKZ61_023155 [Litorilinea aerophila]|uniref:Uncharacterized protein n=1 Tax=Litorilinea aerophila TaxID=1204385 RepID=A0A540V8H0_9CHLR|nr:hypothetical protein [Litorilinea aerophila]MCC9078997.1 hypothetical protein [Litorilinea aerophila]